MAKLILRRLHQWPDIRQSYEIHLDGTPVASIGSGKTVEIEVAPGLHEITATMGPFLSSQPVRLDIAPEGDHRVEVGTILSSPRGDQVSGSPDALQRRHNRRRSRPSVGFEAPPAAPRISVDFGRRTSPRRRHDRSLVPGAQFPQAGFPASPGALNRAEVGRSGRDGGGGRRHGDPGTIERAVQSRLIAYPGRRRRLGLPRGPLKARTSQFVRHSRHRYGPGLTGRLEQLSVSLSARGRNHRPWRRTTLGQVSCDSSFLSPDGRKAWIIVGTNPGSTPIRRARHFAALGDRPEHGDLPRFSQNVGKIPPDLCMVRVETIIRSQVR
jgi:hypothetical protein